MTTPWVVEPEWKGQTAAILASGPSLTREQCEAVRGRCRVIAVNNQGIDTDCDGVRVPAFAPWADILYAADAKWWRGYEDRALKFAGRKVTVRHTLPWPEIYSLTQSYDYPSYDPRPGHVVSGGNSGYQALHLAVQLGARRVLLLGFDMKDGRNGRRHWFGSHPGKLNSRASFASWRSAMEKFSKVLEQMQIEVLNCTPDTALRCFRRCSIEEALRERL
jgi:hypothetical protein